MVYELRTYWAAPGMNEKLHERFRSLTMGIFKRLNMEVIGFWKPVSPGPETGDLVYILRFADEVAMNAAWEAFRSDPEWVAGWAASEADGKLAEKVTSVLLTATDYAPVQ